MSSCCPESDPRALARRDLLRYGLGGAGWLALSPLGSALAAASAAAQASDYKALVCVYLWGGNDAHNLFVPRDAAEYATYAAARGPFAVPQSHLIPLAPASPVGAGYGVHPSASGIARLFESGRLAVVSNVGTLVEPLTKAEFASRSRRVPPQLFSHADQTVQWMTARADENAGVGWCGRVADLLDSGSLLPLNVSLEGTTTLQSGARTAPYVMSPAGVEKLAGFGGAQGARRFTAFRALLHAPAPHVFATRYRDTQDEAMALADLVSGALADGPAITAPFPPDSWFGQQLRMVARTIAVRERLGVRRQIFFVGMTGFDTHADQAALQPRLFTELAAVLAAFQDALDQLGVAPQVTTFTASDFGRSLSPNGAGTDHGWGSHQLVLGGAVLGRRFHGRLPVLALDGPDDVGAGRVLPAVAVEQYGATLARWFGVAEDDLALLFPNLGNFAASDLGFLA